jgi:DNA repair protein RecN (Recombination protein N)
LYDAPESVASQVRVALRKIEEISRIDATLEPLTEILKPAQIAIEDVSATLRDYVARLEADPARLEQIESRLAAIDRLKRKYGGTIEEILAFLGEVSRQIETAENMSGRKAAAEKRRRKLAMEFETLAGQLSARRHAAAGKLAKQLERELEALAMQGTVFEVRLEAAAWSETGMDAATFQVSANIGEAPRPLDKVASGGELSRIALALKVCVSPATNGRTLVFDEVDAGIGGSAADAVGRRLKAISAADQVLCVTHLAQIAGYADHHLAVVKAEVKGRTVAGVQELDGESRTREIGRMLAGQRLTPEALRHAEQLIRTSAAH